MGTRLSTMLSLKFLYKTPLGTFVTGWRRKQRRQAIDKEEELDPLRTDYICSIPRAQWFKGLLLQGYLVQTNILQGLDDFDVRDDDVFIVTYPKSGTTWTEEIVSLIYNDGNTSRVANTLLNDRVEHLEVGRPLGHLRHLRKLKSPRLLATHLPLPLIPKSLRQGKCKMIYVVRNPKDNAVSYFHHHRMSTFLGNYKGSWDDFLYLYMKGYLVYGSWFDHVLPYWRFCQENPDRMLFISFEDLKLDLPGMVSKIASFVGRPLTEEVISTISSHCTFEKMKSNNMVNREVLPITDLFDMTQSKFMRKGIVGDWKNYFTEEQNIAFSKIYNEKMQNTGLEMVFDTEEIDNRNNNISKTDKPLKVNTCTVYPLKNENVTQGWGQKALESTNEKCLNVQNGKNKPNSIRDSDTSERVQLIENEIILSESFQNVSVKSLQNGDVSSEEEFLQNDYVEGYIPNGSIIHNGHVVSEKVSFVPNGKMSEREKFFLDVLPGDIAYPVHKGTLPESDKIGFQNGGIVSSQANIFQNGLSEKLYGKDLSDMPCAIQNVNIEECAT